MKAPKVTLPWWPFYGNDFFGSEKVKPMTWTQVGIYVGLLDHQFRKGSIPADLEALQSILGRGVEQSDIENIISGNFCKSRTEGRLVNPRMEIVRREQAKKNQARRDAGHLGGVAKAKRSNATAMPEQCSTEQSRAEKIRKEGILSESSSPSSHVADGSEGNGKKLSHDGFVRMDKELLKRGHADPNSIIGRYGLKPGGGLEPAGSILDTVLAKDKART